MEIILLIVGALLGYSLERFHELIERRLRIGKLKYVLPVSELPERKIHVRPSIEVFASGRGGKSKRAYTHSSETKALQHLASVLHRLPVNLHFNYDEIDTADANGWIIFGLSRGKSKISKSILDRIGSVSSIQIVKPENAHQYFRDASGNEYHCVHVPDPTFETKVTIDYGLIYRGILDNGIPILLCGGIHMFGTQAALEVALTEPFIERIKKSGSMEFAQLVEVRVREDGITIESESIRWRNLPFVAIKTSK